MATVYKKGNSWICSGFGPSACNVSTTTVTFEGLVQQLPTSKRHLLKIVKKENLELLAQGIREGDILAVSDGSYKDEYGTAAVILIGKNSPCKLIIQAVAPGDGHDMSSYRSKLTGILATFLVVEKLCQCFSLQSGKIELDCDGLSAIQQSSIDSLDVNIGAPCWDIIGAIRKISSISSISWTFWHVEGHRDRNKPADQLDIWEELNVGADHWTKA